MFLARVIGQVVSTRKEENLRGHKLLLLRPMLVDADKPDQFKAGTNTVVAVDVVGAGQGDMVLFAQGSSARQAAGLKSLPVDAAIVGLVDSVDVQGTALFRSGSG
jgi:ethanolamine utilization protein EutN